MAAARDGGESEAAVWLAGVAGAGRPRRARRLLAERGGDGATAGPRAEPGRAGRAAAAAEPLAVAQVAAAVDAGRDLAAAAAADGIAVLVASASGAGDAGGPPHACASGAAASLLAALAADESRPLRALRRHGDAQIATLCGIALGAGERGLGCVCDGIAAIAGAAVAAAIEPDLRPRLRALSDGETATRHGIAAIDASQLEAALD
jgi:NaMN:DMB phosphoribosyltransferase